MRLGQWPHWAWASLTVVASLIRLDYAVGDYSLATGVALLAGSVLGSRDGARTQTLALLGLVPLSVLSSSGSIADWGYFVGHIAAAAVAGQIARVDGRRPPARLVPITLTVMAAGAFLAALAWRDRTLGLQLKTYYTSIIALAMVIALWYALRLVARPSRVLGLVASLAPYYLLGLAWVAMLRITVHPAADGVAPSVSDLVFHGYATHLPGDVLTAVVIAFLTDPKHRFGTSLLR